MATNKRGNGDGSFHQRANGLWVGRATVGLVEGGTKRVAVYGKSRREVQTKLTVLLGRDQRGIRTPDREQTLGQYLDYWMEAIVRATKKDRTVEFYESAIRVQLKPILGTVLLSRFTVQDAQRGFNQLLAAGTGIRTLQKAHQTLRAALSHAEREDLVTRNVARHVVLPAYTKAAIVPWTLEQQQTFLSTARTHEWYAAYLLLLNYGLRRGEVLGLHWTDIDTDNGLIHVRHQLQRIAGKGLVLGTVKTAAGNRVLPLTGTVADALAQLRDNQLRDTHGAAGLGGLVFTSGTGTPVDPKNFVRAFHQIRVAAGLPLITVHHLRHSAATTMKNVGVATKDAQSILGHAHVSTTMQIYQHSDVAAQRSVLDQLGASLSGPVGTPVGTQPPATSLAELKVASVTSRRAA